METKQLFTNFVFKIFKNTKTNDLKYKISQFYTGRSFTLKTTLGKDEIFEIVDINDKENIKLIFKQNKKNRYSVKEYYIDLNKLLSLLDRGKITFID